MRQEASTSADRPRSSLADVTEWRMNQALARSASHYQAVTTALESCMARTFEHAPLVHQLCLWNHMSSGNDGNLPHHEIVIFLWKREIKIFIWVSYPSFHFLYIFKNLYNILHLEKLGFYSFLGLQHTDLGRAKSGLEEHRTTLLRIQEWSQISFIQPHQEFFLFLKQLKIKMRL